jgi:hypothetical protein
MPCSSAAATPGRCLDRKHLAIARVWKGISNSKVRVETVPKARPLMADGLRALLKGPCFAH